MHQSITDGGVKYISLVANIELLETLLKIDKKGAIEKLLAHYKEEIKKYEL